MANVSNRAVLVDLETHQWGARKSSQEANNAVAKHMGSNPKSGNYTKFLISKEHMKPLVDAFQAAGDEYRARTAPWLDKGGQRALSAKGYQDFVNRMNWHKDNIEALVENLYQNYDAWVNEAERDLNGMFHRNEYPPRSMIKSHYTFTWHMMPFPSTEDFRLDLGDEEFRRLKEDTEAAIQAAVEETQRDVIKRVRNVVSNMVEALTKYNPDAEDKRAGRFYPSLVGNVRELVALLPTLNFTEDIRLDALAQRIDQELCQHDVDVLKDDDKLRKNVAEQADDILKKMGEMFA